MHALSPTDLREHELDKPWNLVESGKQLATRRPRRQGADEDARTRNHLITAPAGDPIHLRARTTCSTPPTSSTRPPFPPPYIHGILLISRILVPPISLPRTIPTCILAPLLCPRPFGSIFLRRIASTWSVGVVIAACISISLALVCFWVLWFWVHLAFTLCVFFLSASGGGSCACVFRGLCVCIHVCE